MQALRNRSRAAAATWPHRTVPATLPKLRPTPAQATCARRGALRCICCKEDELSFRRLSRLSACLITFFDAHHTMLFDYDEIVESDEFYLRLCATKPRQHNNALCEHWVVPARARISTVGGSLLRALQYD